MAKKSDSPASVDTLTPAQKRAFELFDGEPLTPNDVANRLDVSVATVRQHLKALVAAKRIDATRRGRVVYYHKPGVEVPEEENEPLSDEDAAGDEDVANDSPEPTGASDEDDQTNDPAEPRVEFEGVLFADASEHAIPAFNEEEHRASSIDQLLKEITDEQIPHVIEAMERMSALKNNNAALQELYDECVAEHGLNKHLLIRFFMVTVSHGIDPSTLFARKKTAIEPPATPKEQAAAIDGQELGNPEIASSRDTSHALLMDRIDAMKQVLAMQEEIAALETVHGMHEAELPSPPIRKVRTLPQKETAAQSKLVIDPETTPSRQMEKAIFSRKADELGQHETNLAASLCAIESRLSKVEWAEYQSLITMTRDGTHTDSSKQRFRALLGQAHHTLPKHTVDELCSILLVPPLLRDEQQLARYDQLLHDFLEA